ncbi:5-carboxymethyl-2-hydroxymuconate Delta-isomerase [Streptomyces indicus]|uniref:5-carboxymethyl-2-hydroxymuconate isomerase n=1 Tax=Streptomyces indicus TaxID=417292 RepID=A0A1G8YQ35_9ACTN|nr:isomerase [Streptomyces indicus]SDK04160.1 5-carboxymethyl-2-hydroxymuconate isomerase [Streptomyces indicus]
MPQITVDHPAQLTDAFDRRGFALALHPLVVEIAGARLAACKTRFRTTEENVVGDEAAGPGVLHIEIALLAGRSEETKKQLATAAVELAGKFVAGTSVAGHVSAEVRDLDGSYAKV